MAVQLLDQREDAAVPARRSDGQAIAISQDHWATLGAIRFFLALIVVGCHYRLLAPAIGGVQHPFSSFAQSFGGTAAVLAFLLISGFSIAYSIAHGETGFYRRRLARLWPVLIVGIVIEHYARGGFSLHSFRNSLPTLFFLNGFVSGLWLAPTWTLSIEAACYLAAPLFNKKLWLVGVLTIGSAAFHFFGPTLKIGPYPYWSWGVGAVGVFWAWGAGFLAYRLLDKPMIGLLVVAIGPLMIGVGGQGDGPFGTVLWAIASFGVLFGQFVVLPESVRRVFNYLGDLSYPLFITHLSVFGVMKPLGIVSWIEIVPVCLLVSVVTLHIVDRPLRRVIGNSRLFGRNPERYAALLVALLIAACVAAALHAKAF